MSVLSFEGFAAFEVPTAHAPIMARVSSCAPPTATAARVPAFTEMNAHLCMIIGYNSRTKEIATSDSWGKEFAERWLTLEEAAALSQPGEFWEVKW